MQTGVIQRKGRWRHVEAVEFATLTMVDWFNTRRLLEPIGYRSPVVTVGEQRKYHNFWTYCVHGLPNTAPDRFRIPFTAGHTRRMPRLTAGPFRYKRYADCISTSPSDIRTDRSSRR